MVDAQANILQEFDKQHLIPYGEFIPLRHLLPKGIQNMIGKRLDYSPGYADRLISLPKGKKALILICGESAIPNLASTSYEQADMLINMTNDSWFDFTIGPYQHFDMSRVRAVSSGLPVLRIANTGQSAIINRYGQIIKRLEMNHQSVLKLDTFDLF